MRKDTIGVCCLLASTAMILMIAWFFQAHPVVASPENTRIMFIEIGVILRLLAIAQYPKSSESLLDFVTCILYQRSL